MNDFINKMGEYWSQLSFDKLGDILTYHHNAPILFSSGLFFFLLSVSWLFICRSGSICWRVSFTLRCFPSISIIRAADCFSFSCCLSQHPILHCAVYGQDGFPMEAQSMGCLEPVYRLRAVGIFQILQFPTGDHGCRCSWVGVSVREYLVAEHYLSAVGYLSAGRHFLLYLPDHQLRDWCVPG